MKALILSTVFASLIFLIIDLIWLSFSVKSFYRPNLGPLLTDSPVMWAAVLFYVIYVIGISIIIIQPGLNSLSSFSIFWRGALFGLVAYGTYNLTNMATVKNWSSNVVFVDMFWGSLLTGTSCYLGVFLYNKFFS